MRLSSLRTDIKKEKDGVFVPWVGDVRLKIRRSGNEDYRAAVAEGLKPHRAAWRAELLSSATVEEIQRAAMARHVLVGWENLVDDKGEQIPYEPETAEKLLRDPELHDLYEFVLVASSRMENFRREEAKEDLGNSPRSSTGSVNGASSRSNSGSSLVEVSG